ncbi:MAG: glycosyltransferase family 2 protein [Candidatus Micrarchaeota archaeon]
MFLIAFAVFLSIYLFVFLLLALEHKKRQVAPEVLDPISFLISAHNEEKTIADSLTSALSQKGISVKEIVVIVDNSTDRTAEICKSLAEQNPCVIIIPKNDGQPSKPKVIRIGLQKISTKYAVLLDADTILEKNAVAETFSFMKNNRAEFGTCIVDPMPAKSLKYEIISSDKLFRQRILQLGRAEINCANLPGCFYIGNAGWLKENISNSFVEDLVLSYKLIGENNKISVVPKVLAFEQERLQFRSFFLQRMRWTIGNISAFPHFLRAFKNKSFSTIFGLFSFPLFWYIIQYFVFFLLALSFFNWEARISLVLVLAAYLPALILARTMFSRISAKDALISCAYLAIASAVYLAALFGSVGMIFKKGFFFYDSALFKRMFVKERTKNEVTISKNQN